MSSNACLYCQGNLVLTELITNRSLLPFSKLCQPFFITLRSEYITISLYLVQKYTWIFVIFVSFEEQMMSKDKHSYIFFCAKQSLLYLLSLNILIWGVQTGLCSCAFQSYLILVSRFNMLFTIKQQIYIKLYCLILLYLEP